MSRKYKLTKEYKIFGKYTKLFRIKALKSFSDVKKGDLGGWIQSEHNLSHEGNCWIYDNAIVCDFAQVSGNSTVSDNSRVSNHAIVADNSYISGNSIVSGNAKIYDNAMIAGNGLVTENAKVEFDGRVFGDAKVYGDSLISGNGRVYGKARVFNKGIVRGYSRVFEEELVTKETISIGVPGSPTYGITFTDNKVNTGEVSLYKFDWINHNIETALLAGIESQEKFSYYKSIINPLIQIHSKE